MEIYVAYKDYIWMMDFVEKMLEKIALKLHGTTVVKIGDKEIDFKAGYRRLPILEAIKEYAGVDVKGMGVDELRETCKKLNVEFEPSMGVAQVDRRHIRRILRGASHRAYIHHRLPCRDVSADKEAS